MFCPIQEDIINNIIYLLNNEFVISCLSIQEIALKKKKSSKEKEEETKDDEKEEDLDER